MVATPDPLHLCIPTLAQMNWTPLTDLTQLDAIDDGSRTRPILLFKHSTSCSISRAALARLERAWTDEDAKAHAVYYLDLWKHRPISNAIAERYRVTHESPQVLVIVDGRCVHHASHFSITYADTKNALAA